MRYVIMIRGKTRSGFKSVLTNGRLKCGKIKGNIIQIFGENREPSMVFIVDENFIN